MTNGNEWHKGETVQGISLPTEKVKLSLSYSVYYLIFK